MVLSIAAITARMPIKTKITVIEPAQYWSTKRPKQKKKKKQKIKRTFTGFFSIRFRVFIVLRVSEYSSFSRGVSTSQNQKFQITSKFESHKWEFPIQMVDYVNHQFAFFIPEKDVEENLFAL